MDKIILKTKKQKQKNPPKTHVFIHTTTEQFSCDSDREQDKPKTSNAEKGHVDNRFAWAEHGESPMQTITETAAVTKTASLS